MSQSSSPSSSPPIETDDREQSETPSVEQGEQGDPEPETETWEEPQEEPNATEETTEETTEEPAAEEPGAEESPVEEPETEEPAAEEPVATEPAQEEPLDALPVEQNIAPPIPARHRHRGSVPRHFDPIDSSESFSADFDQTSHHSDNYTEESTSITTNATEQDDPESPLDTPDNNQDSLVPAHIIASYSDSSLLSRCNVAISASCLQRSSSTSPSPHLIEEPSPRVSPDHVPHNSTEDTAQSLPSEAQSNIGETKLPHHTRRPTGNLPTKHRRDSHGDKTEIPPELPHRHRRDSRADKSEFCDTAAVSTRAKEISMTSPRRHQYAYRSTLENLEESIIEGEETFLKILNQLRDVYLQPLLSLISLESSPTTPNTTPASPPSSLFPDALADLKQLIDAQSQFVVHLRDRRLLAQPLAANYALFPNLFVAYKKYIGGQMIFIMKLSTLMQNNLKIAALVDSKTEDPQANKLTIWDMLGISVRRLPQLIDVLTAQFELLVASDIGRCASIDYGKLYKKRYLLPSPGQVFPDSCRQGKQALDSLAGLVVDAQRAEEFYSAMLFVQSISTRNRHESIPNNPARRMFKQGEMLLMQNHDVGLSVTIPVVLLLFSDCLAICTKQSSEHSHCFQLHSLYPTPSLIVCDTEATTKALTFTIDIIKTLPTGWIETVVLNPHHRVWSLEKSKITQQEPPSDYISAVMGPVTFVASRAEEKQDWLFAFASATSFAYIKSSIPTEKSAKLKKNKPANTKKKSKKTTAPKSNFGVPLDTLITRDRIHHPGCNLPILVSRLVHHVLSYGLAEEGILRLAGDKEGVEEIKLKIDNSKITDFSFIGMYIHNVSTILKQFLRELPEPLIPYSLGDMFLSISSLPKHLQASALMMNLRELPPFTHHLPLLRCVLQCLYIVSLNSHLNQMTPENVAIVMAPNIFRLPPGSNPVAQIPFTPKATIVTAAMIANYPVLFESPDSPSLDNDVDFVRFKRKISAFPKTTLHNLAHIPARNQIWIVDTEGYIISVDSNQCTFGSRTQVVGVKNVVSLCASGPNVWIATPLGLRVIATDTLLVVFQDDQACYGVVSTGSEVWVGGQGCVTVYDSTSFSMIKTINVGDGEVRNLTKVGLSIWCSTHQATSPTQDIHILDCSIYAQECHFAAHSRKINSICCVEGATVWSCCDEGIISVWDVSSQRRKEKLDLGQGSIHCLAALRKQVWASTKSNVTTILEARTSKKIGAIRGYHREPILALIPIPTKFDTKEKALGVTRPTAWDVWSMAVESVCVWDARYLDCRFADKPKDKLKAFKS